MTKASKARKAHVDSADVIIETTKTVILDAAAPVAPVASTALALLRSVFQPQADQSTDYVQMDDMFFAKYRSAIKARFNAGAKFVDLIGTLNLTPSDTDAIEKLRVIFYDTWLECIFERRGMTETTARKYRETLFDTKRAAWSEDDKRAYGATKTAWVDVRERANLKAAPTPNNVNKGQGKKGAGEGAGEGADEGADEGAGEGDAKKVTTCFVELNTFEAICQEVKDVARYLDAIVAQGAKVKCAGLLQHVADCARGLRVAAHASELEMDADKAQATK